MTNHTPPHPHTSDSVRSGFGSNESKRNLFILSGDSGRGNVVMTFCCCKFSRETWTTTIMAEAARLSPLPSEPTRLSPLPSEPTQLSPLPSEPTKLSSQPKSFTTLPLPPSPLRMKKFLLDSLLPNPERTESDV